jgi:hypothetical protein
MDAIKQKNDATSHSLVFVLIGDKNTQSNRDENDRKQVVTEA